MGCDIHIKTFVFSKVENRMIPATSVFEDSWYRYMPLIVNERDYNLFGLFGNSARSYYKELDCFEEDSYPDFMKESAATCAKIAESDDYHTRRWCYVNKLRESLVKLKEKLKDPKEYENCCEPSPFDNFSESENIDKNEYQKMHELLFFSIDTTIARIDKLVEFFSDFTELDSTKIAIVTWMDS